MDGGGGSGGDQLSLSPFNVISDGEDNGEVDEAMLEDGEVPEEDTVGVSLGAILATPEGRVDLRRLIGENPELAGNVTMMLQDQLAPDVRERTLELQVSSNSCLIFEKNENKTLLLNNLLSCFAAHEGHAVPC